MNGGIAHFNNSKERTGPSGSYGWLVGWLEGAWNHNHEHTFLEVSFRKIKP